MALNDLEMISLFTPDNTQVAMLKQEVEQLMSKSKQYSHSDFKDEKSWNFMHYMEFDKNKKDSESVQKKKVSRVSILAKIETK